MTKEKTILKNKLKEYYSEIFQKELIKEIINVGKLKVIPKGQLLINIGDELTHIPLIIHGAVKISLEDSKGDEVYLYHLEKGETCAISFVNCIHKSKSMFRGVAEQDTEGIFIPINKLDKWLAKYKTWRHFIIDSYHFRLIGLIHSIENLVFSNLEDRLMEYLYQKAQVMNTNILKITHDEIANDLFSGRTVITRLLKDLKNEGKIDMKRGKIIISAAMLKENLFHSFQN